MLRTTVEGALGPNPAYSHERQYAAQRSPARGNAMPRFYEAARGFRLRSNVRVDKYRSMMDHGDYGR